MLVPGDMTAICAASTMNAPAEAARPPGGIHTATGIFDDSIDCTTPRIASTSPPGVSSRKIIMSAFEVSMTSRTNSSICTPTVPESSARVTVLFACAGRVKYINNNIMHKNFFMAMILLQLILRRKASHHQSVQYLFLLFS